MTRPLTQLLGFARVTLQPGQSAELCFDIHSDRFAFVAPDLTRVVEPDAIQLHAGSSSVDIRAEAVLRLIGAPRPVDHQRHLTTNVIVRMRPAPS